MQVYKIVYTRKRSKQYVQETKPLPSLQAAKQVFHSEVNALGDCKLVHVYAVADATK